jgi:prevent-host-death family protein
MRQSISKLIEIVRKGRQILITDRGKPIAQLVPVRRFSPRPYPGRTEFRRSMPILHPPLSLAISEDRKDRLRSENRYPSRVG